MTKQQKHQEALEYLRKHLKPGDTVWTVLLHASRSGMQRTIAVYIIHDNAPYPVWGTVAEAIGACPDRDHGGVKMSGCGMDMGFKLVYDLSRALFPQGFGCLGDGCPANDHSNGDRDYTLGHPHPNAGGYALKQRWL